MSPAEYLAFERASDQKHEYAGGEVFAMAGGTLEHSMLTANILAAFKVAFRDSPCRPLTSDMRVKIARSGRYVYPDGSVVCGEPELEDEARDTLLNPTVIVEVLSDSSEAYDRGDKFAQYQSVPSVQHCVLASQRSSSSSSTS